MCHVTHSQLGWFFNLEARRYIIGILALSLVSVFNLIPPRIIRRVIDAIAGGNLTSRAGHQSGRLASEASLIICSPLCLAALRLRDNEPTGPDSTNSLVWALLPAWRRPSMPVIGPGTDGPCTQRCRSLVMTAGAGSCRPWMPPNYPALNTLATMFWILDWRLTLVAILPLQYWPGD